jgi:hypothetical protein
VRVVSIFVIVVGGLDGGTSGFVLEFFEYPI